MSRVILILVVLAGIIFWWHWQNTPEPEQRKKLLHKTIIGGVLVGAVLMVVTGHMHWLGAVIAGLLAFLRQWSGVLLRYMPVLMQMYRTHAPAGRAPNSSSVTTKIIRMDLDHDTGKLSGQVLAGTYKGSALDDLNREQLSELFEYCRRNDLDSARLLEGYLAARFGEDSSRDTAGHERATVPTTKMTLEEALQVLGLAGRPTAEEINKAYRRIMQQLHPDRGGSEYFATKANQARDVLMGQSARSAAGRG
jgi:hypothetical protein